MPQAICQRRCWVKEFARLDAERRTEVWGIAIPPKVEVVPPVVEVPVPPVEEVTEEEAIARVEAVEITPEIVTLRDRVFEYLANHPDRTRMVELEREFGLPRIQMARILRNLIDENKVEKRDLLYFAI